MRTRKPTLWERKFGETLRRLRRQAGLTQEDLGTAVKVGHDTIRKWERGQRTPGLEIATRLADALECSLDELAGRTGKRQRQG
jgi:transcriptional regulator with XRE-family HTH domain